MTLLEADAHLDEEARRSLRAWLKQHMLAHRIGVPALKMRIEKADAPRGREVPLSTLQRFIAGKHRTSDAYVGMFYAFQIASEEAAQPSAPGVGDALCAFFDAAPIAAAAGQQSIRLEDIAGSYETLRAGVSVAGLAADPTVPAQRHSVLSFSVVPDKSYLMAEEAVEVRHLSDFNVSRRRHYEGFFIPAGGLYHVVLRCSLTRQPKMYSLKKPVGRAMSTVAFEGDMFEIPFLQDRTSRLGVWDAARAQLSGPGTLTLLS